MKWHQFFSYRLAEIQQSEEYNSLMIRLFLGIFASAYVAIGAYYQIFSLSASIYFTIAISFFLLSLLILISLFHQPVSPLRRYLTLLMDITYTTLTIYITNGQTRVLWLLYIWLYIGYGSRYGKNYLFVAQFLAITQYAWVIHVTGIWATEKLDLITQMIILLTLPFYLLSMIRRLHLARAEALKVSQLKSRFLASMSHEIRTPLNGIAGTISLLNKTNLDAYQQKMIKALNSSVDILLNLIDDILDFSRIEADQIFWQQAPVNLHQLIKDIVSTLSVSAQNKNLSIKTRIDPDIPTCVLSDKKHLNQILLNLLGNAIKFTHQGEIILTLQLQHKKLQKIQVYFAISDTGIGIAPENQQLIFERFTRASDDLHIPGSGLGVTICKELVEQAGGHINLQSTPGEGSCFSFSLLFEQCTQDTAENNQASKITRDASPKNATLKILIAEDDDINAMVLEEFLHDLGHQTCRVDNGKACIDAVRRQNFDVVFMDIHMPVLSGLQATKKIREKYPDLVIIGLTASATTLHQQQCLQAGMNDFLPKPVTPEVLQEKLHNAG